MIGLKRGTVSLFPHEEEWEKEAARTVEKLKNILGDTAADIQHIGSTAVRSICAKPIIDIAVGVYSFEDVMLYESELRNAGFFYRSSSIADQLLFAAGSFYEGTGDEQTHFIHVVKFGGRAWTDYINFRNYLNENIAAAREYEALKLRLAAEAPVDSGRERYLAGKHDFIVNTLRKAAVSALLGKTVKIKIDRPLGTEHKGMLYTVNYGYVPGTFGGDGEELDVYLLGVNTPVKEYECSIIGAIYRKNDVEDKLIGAPEDVMFTKEEIEDAVRFQEQWFITETVVI